MSTAAIEKTIRWAERAGPTTISDQLPGAIRAGNFARAAILRDVLDRKLARRAAWVAQRSRPRPVRPTRLCTAWEPLAEDVARGHGVTVADMLSGWRDTALRQARFEFWFLLWKRGIAFAEIGRRTGGYDHTSVRHGVLQWAARIQSSATPVAASPSLALESTNG